MSGKSNTPEERTLLAQAPRAKLPISVFDLHLHLPYSGEDLWGEWGRGYIGRFGQAKFDLLNGRNGKAQEVWWKSYGFPLPDNPQPSAEECARRYAQEVEDYGLLGLCFLTGGGNDKLARVLQPYSKLHGFAYLDDPFDPKAPAELHRAVTELGLKGLKLFGPAIIEPLSDHRLDALWSTCANLQIPVLIHFGPLGGEGGVAAGANISPIALHDVAKGFPEVDFIVPHFGCGYPTELMHLMWACPNVYTDTSGNNEWRRYMWPAPTLHDLFRQFYELFGPQRILFGSDASWFPRGWVAKYFEEQYRAVREVGISEEHQKLIFAGNALRLLQLL